jgi:hypothetical protein
LGSYSLWVLIKRRRDGYMITASAIALRSADYAKPGDYLTDYAIELPDAQRIGERLATVIRGHLDARGDSILSVDTTIED